MERILTKTSLTFLLGVVAPVWAWGQTPRDVPSQALRPGVVKTLPLDPQGRANLEEAVKKRDYAHAEELLVEEIERNPKSAKLLTALASIFFLDGKYLNTAVALKKAEALGPLSDYHRFTLALSYIILNHRDWARPELEKLAASDPKNPLYPYWLGRLDYDAMQLKSAVSNLQEALVLDPFFMKAYDNLGLCYEAVGNHEEAIKMYQDAIRLNRTKAPSSPWPPLNLGALLVKLGRVEEAESILRESLRYDPRFPQAHFRLGLVLEKQMKHDEALEALRKAATLDPTYAVPHYVLGRIYWRRGEKEKAEAAFNTFRKLKREHPRERPR